ncbi:MAG TPA: hypothetical protein VMT49_01640 [Steroidobacteraceae bacterium]|nr:hypothetical protein [Steroidobacteraceae bacterium]
MGAGDDRPGDKPQRIKPTTALGPPGSRGRDNTRDGIERDPHGNAVWKWAVDTGKHAIDSTSRLLKRLEVPGLRLEDDDKPGMKPKASPRADGAAPPSRGPAGPPGRAAGHDPYGRPTSPRKSLAPQPGAVRKPVTAPAPRRSWWQRLFRRR